MLTIVTGKLDRKARNALADDQFAFPRTRQVPIHDAHHVKLAWGMVDVTKGVTTEERAAARTKIVSQAGAFGLDTGDWHRVKAMAIECMSLAISVSDDHPNKMAFEGVLTKLDEPSDAPPGGSNGKLVIVTADAARKALSSLLGMAVDFTPSFDGHDARNKIGLITSADIVGNDLLISGFIYAADFPEVAALIKKLKDVLGFSFEAQRLYVEDMGAEILRITELTFTGAAILLKDKAAYTTTSIAASSAEEEIDMTPEELKALLGPMLTEAFKPLTDRLATVEANNKTLVDNLQANANVRAMVEPHATALEACGATMEAAGIGADPKFGHAAALRRMAGAMRAEAAIGKVPHIWRDHDYPSYASAEVVPGKGVAAGAAGEDEIKKLIADAMKPLQDELAAAKTKLSDHEAKARMTAASPGRKTVAPQVTALLSKASISLPDGEGKLSVADVDKSMASANLNMTQRIMLKNELGRLGAL